MGNVLALVLKCISVGFEDFCIVWSARGDENMKHIEIRLAQRVKDTFLLGIVKRMDSLGAGVLPSYQECN